MYRNRSTVSASGSMILVLVLVNAIIIRTAFVSDGYWHQALIITLPLLVLALYYHYKKLYIMKDELLLLNEDVKLLHTYIKGGSQLTSFDKKNADRLKAELNRGTVLQKEDFPADVIRLNSLVKIQDKATGQLLELTLVLPEKAAISDGRVSIMAPIGTALLGYRKGQSVKWEVPAGEKHFRIMEVINPLST